MGGEEGEGGVRVGVSEEAVRPEKISSAWFARPKSCGGGQEGQGENLREEQSPETYDEKL